MWLNRERQRLVVGDKIRSKIQMGTFKKSRKLEEHADLAPEAENIQLPKIMAVQEDSPRWRLPEAVESSEQRRFAAATGADDPNDHAFWYVQAQPIEYGASSGL